MSKKYYNLNNAPKFMTSNDIGVIKYKSKGVDQEYLIPTYNQYGRLVGHGTEKYPYKLKNIDVYPNTITLQTYNPLHENYLVGHSKVIFRSEDPKSYNAVVNTKIDDPNYNLVTNNCSDDTRRVLESTFGIPLDYNFFTTPGDVRDYFKDRGAKEVDLSNRKHKPTTTQIMYVNSEQYNRGLSKIKQINEPRYKNRIKNK